MIISLNLDSEFLSNLLCYETNEHDVPVALADEDLIQHIAENGAKWILASRIEYWRDGMAPEKAEALRAWADQSIAKAGKR